MEKIEVQKKVMEAFEKTMQPEKTLAVCPISGVYMSSTDNEQRHQDHLMGKQFQGWKVRSCSVIITRYGVVIEKLLN